MPSVSKDSPSQNTNTKDDSAAKKPQKERILVIKHGALGDFVLSTGPFSGIRKHHPNAHITLLTTSPYVGLAEQSPYFDEIWTDTRPKWWQLSEWTGLIRKMRNAGFSRVYDLQTSFRSNMYFRLMGKKKPEWSGSIEWCSHPHRNPYRKYMHTVPRQAEQLLIAGLERVPKPTVYWLKSDISGFALPEHFVLIVAGGSKGRPEKRWHKQGFAELAKWLLKHHVVPVFIGGKDEEYWIKNITEHCEGAINLCNQTSFADIVELSRHALAAVGNDTGPMHLIAAAKCPSVVLFSQYSNPLLCAPVGKHVRIIEVEELTDLESEEVVDALNSMLILDSSGKVSKSATYERKKRKKKMKKKEAERKKNAPKL